MIGKNHYVATVAFETEKLDAEGNPKTKKTRILIEDADFNCAYVALTEYLRTESRGFSIKSITEAKFEDVIGGAKKASKVVKLDHN